MTTALTCMVPEVARELGIAESTVYERVRRGDIPNVGVGRTVRIPRRWLDTHLADAGAPRETVSTVGEGQFS